MTVRLVTFRKGGTRDDMVEAAKPLKSWWTSHGVQDMTLSRVIAGSDANHWVAVVTWNDWEAYGRGMAAAMADPEFQSILAAFDAFSEVTGRRLLSSIDL